MRQTNIFNYIKEKSMKPSMGRVVIYNHSGSADGKYLPSKSPAIVQGVDEDSKCDLFVMSNTGGIFFAKKCSEGEEGSQWNWPPRAEE